MRRRPPTSSDAGFQAGSRSHGTPGTPGTPRRAPADKRPTKTGAPSHKTSQIPRPTTAEHVKAREEAAAELARTNDTSHEFTRPIAREKQLVRGRGKRTLVVVGLGVIGTALVVALFVLPVQAWLRQQDDIDRKQLELVALEQANAALTDEVNRLKTPEGIEEAAREEIGFVQRGERRLTVLPAPDAPVTLPTGWPYDAIAQIIVVKSQGAVTSG